MISNTFRQKTIDFCKSLISKNGLAAEYIGGELGLQATLSACKALNYLGCSMVKPDEILSSVKVFYDSKVNAFCEDKGKPTVFSCAAALRPR